MAESPVPDARESGGEGDRRSRRALLRSGGIAMLAGLVGLIVPRSPATAQRRERRQRSGEGRSGGGGGAAPPSTTIATSRSPSLDVTNPARSGEVVAVSGTVASSEGVAGLFVASDGGTALEARSAQQGGVALRTRGRVVLGERSGVASASGGAEFVIPVAGGLRDDAIIVATLQDHHPGVFVVSASVLDPDEGLIIVRLNQALAEPGRVGWVVLG